MVYLAKQKGKEFFSLKDISEKDDGGAIEKAVEKMHSNYEKLDAVFTK